MNMESLFRRFMSALLASLLASGLAQGRSADFELTPRETASVDRGETVILVRVGFSVSLVRQEHFEMLAASRRAPGLRSLVARADVELKPLLPRIHEHDAERAVLDGDQLLYRPAPETRSDGKRCKQQRHLSELLRRAGARRLAKLFWRNRVRRCFGDLEAIRDAADMRVSYTKSLYDYYVKPDLEAANAAPEAIAA